MREESETEVKTMTAELSQFVTLALPRPCALPGLSVQPGKVAISTTNAR